MMANQLLLNPAKTKVIWCSSPRRQHLIPIRTIRNNNTSILQVRSMRVLGVYLNANVSMKTYVIATVRSCFAALWQICSIRRSPPYHALLTLIHALMVSKVDYCSQVLSGITGHLMERLLSVLNAAAQLVFYTRWSDNITPLLCKLQWWRVPKQIQFRLCMLTYRCLQGTATPYLAESLHLTTVVTARCRCVPRQLDAPCTMYSTIIP